MATTEEIVARYRLDLDELKVQVKELENQYGKADKAAKESASNTEKAFNKLGDKLKDLGKTLLAAFAVDRIIAFGKASVDAFAESEAGALKLKAAVGARGGLTADFATLTKQAEELAATTIFDDDQIKAAQTLALQFGLNRKQVESLIPVVADFAAATGQDLNGALQSVLGGINGQERALKAYGVELTAGASKAENFVTIQEKLTATYQGQAAALKDTLGGALGESTKALGELEEALGQALAPAVAAAANAVTDLLKSFTPSGPSPVMQLEEEIKQLRISAIQLNTANTTQEGRVKLIKELQTRYPDYLGSLNAETISNKELNAAINKVNGQLVSKLVLLRQDEKFQKAAQLAATRQEEVLQREQEAYAALAEAQKQGVNLGGSNLTIQQKLATAANQLNAKIALQSKGFSLTATDAGLAYSKIKNAISLLEYANTNLANSSNDVKVADENRIAVAKRLGISLEDLSGKTEKLVELDYKNMKDAELAKISQNDTFAADELERRKKSNESKLKADQEASKQAIEIATKQAAEELKIRQQLAADSLKQDETNLDAYGQARARAINEQFNNQTNAAKAAATQQQADLLDQLQQGLISYSDYEKKKAAIAASIPNNEAERGKALLQNDLVVLEGRLQNAKDYGMDTAKIEQDIADKKAAIQQASTAIEQANAEQRVLTAEEEAKLKEQILQQELETRQKFNEAIVANATQLLDNLLAFGNHQSENNIARLEQEQADTLSLYDTQQADLDASLQNRLISQKDYEEQSANLKLLRVKSEKETSAQIAAIKKKQDDAARVQALFRITVDTARAIQAQLAEVPLPAGAPLVALIAASGLLQAATVLTAKPPQYAEGVDWVPLNGNKRGRDTVPAMLDEGERVISRRKNLKHWELYQAIDNDRLPDYIFRNYTMPALERERASGGAVARAMQQAIEGSRTASNLPPDNTELRRLWRRGLTINNLDELAAMIASGQPSPYRA